MSTILPNAELVISGRRDWARLERRLEELNRSYARAPWKCFGNEARCALLSRVGLFDDLYARFPAPPGHRPPSLEIYLTRSCVEPIVYSSWPRFVSWDISPAWALDTTGMLIGRRATARSTQLQDAAFGELPSMVFAPVSEASNWLDAILQLRERGDLGAIQEALIVYALVLIYHPMADGNGRLARALFHGSLCHRLGMDAPFLAVAPVIRSTAFHHMKVLRELSHSHDWDDYLNKFHDFVDLALAVQEFIEDSDRTTTALCGVE